MFVDIASLNDSSPSSTLPRAVWVKQSPAFREYRVRPRDQLADRWMLWQASATVNLSHVDLRLNTPETTPPSIPTNSAQACSMRCDQSLAELDSRRPAIGELNV